MQHFVSPVSSHVHTRLSGGGGRRFRPDELLEKLLLELDDDELDDEELELFDEELLNENMLEENDMADSLSTGGVPRAR